MDIEFHYWITGIVALKAGFNDKEANIIAYSSQHVDDNEVLIDGAAHNIAQGVMFAEVFYDGLPDLFEFLTF